jgi:hypothetical protein
MGEAKDYAGLCPACGGQVYQFSWQSVENEIEVDYICHACGKVFDTL